MKPTTTIKRPVLRYHGGKWKLAPWIIAHLPTKHRVYVEPFGGAASVLMQKPRSRMEVYNDLWGDVVGLFRVLQNPAQAAELERLIQHTPYARAEFEKAYLHTTDPVEKARRLIVRTFMGHGSTGLNPKSKTGFRAHGRGIEKPPSWDWSTWHKSIPAFTERMAGVILECKDANSVMEMQDDAETLFYIDPPYVHDTRVNPGGKCYVHEMSNDQHATMLATIHDAKGMVVLSAYRHKLYDFHLSDWHQVHASSYSLKGMPRIETLYINPTCWERLQAEQHNLFSQA